MAARRYQPARRHRRRGRGATRSRARREDLDVLPRQKNPAFFWAVVGLLAIATIVVIVEISRKRRERREDAAVTANEEKEDPRAEAPAKTVAAIPDDDLAPEWTPSSPPESSRREDILAVRRGFSEPPAPSPEASTATGSLPTTPAKESETPRLAVAKREERLETTSARDAVADPLPDLGADPLPVASGTDRLPDLDADPLPEPEGALTASEDASAAATSVAAPLDDEAGTTRRTRRVPEDAPWTLPREGYAAALEKMAVQKASVNGMDVTVRLIPDLYRYRMALGLEELASIGYRGEELEKKIKSLHGKHRSDKRKALFQISLVRGDPNTHCFLRGSFKMHVELRRGPKLSFSTSSGDPLPRFYTFQVFESTKGVSRKIFKQKLANFTRVTFEVTVRHLDLEKADPIELALKDIVLAKHRGGLDSVNLQTRQISCIRWSSCNMPRRVIRFNPARWKEPAAPAELEDILDRLK